MTNPSLSPIDLNSASENELVERLTFSARLAKRIIALRPYQSIDQLKMVWGIDPEVVQRILPAVTVLHPEEKAPEMLSAATSNPPEMPALQKEADQFQKRRHSNRLPNQNRPNRLKTRPSKKTSCSFPRRLKSQPPNLFRPSRQKQPKHPGK